VRYRDGRESALCAPGNPRKPLISSLMSLAAMLLVAVRAASAAVPLPPAPAPAAKAEPVAPSHPVFWVMDNEPAIDHPESVWMGFASKKWAAVEAQVEERVRDIRRKEGRPDVTALEELRFLGRVHAREGSARGKFGHQSDIWGYVSDRARILYGWKHAEWVLPVRPAPPHAQVSDDAAGGGDSADGYVTMWMNSPRHKEAILWPENRFIGMAIGGKGGMAHLVFAGLTSTITRRVMALQPLYKSLETAKSANAARPIMAGIVAAKEGSAFIRIAPLLADADPEMRLLAVTGLLAIRTNVPEAFGPIFALVDMGLTSSDPEVVKRSADALAKITGRKFDTPDAWRAWWHAECRGIIENAGM